MGILGSILGGIAGALFGDKIGIAGFGGAINGAIPGAITGLVVGGLLEDKFSASQNRKFPLDGTPEPELNLYVRQMETKIIESVCNSISARGLTVPEIDEYLSWIARYKALDMTMTDTMDLVGGRYGKLSEMLEGFGYQFNSGVICVGGNYYGEREYMPSWKQCPEIQPLLFGDNYVKIGVGYVREKGYFSVILVK